MPKLLFSAIAAAVFLIAPFSPAAAQGSSNYLKKPRLQVDIPTVQFSDAIVSKANSGTQWIGEYIAGVYRYAIGIAGIIAAVVIMGAGVMWLVAGGRAGQVQEAKEWIKAAVTGLVLALTSYTILYAVNPQLTTFGPLTMSTIKFSSEASSAARASYSQQHNWTDSTQSEYTLDQARAYNWQRVFSGLDSEEDIKAYIQFHEGGPELRAYEDAGFYSIGYGHYLAGQYSAAEAKNLTISQKEANELFAQDYQQAAQDARRVAQENGINWNSLSMPRQGVLIDMAYNMGGGSSKDRTGLAGFQNTLRHVKNGEWEEAANGILNSRYANQVKARAKHNAAVMLDG